ncbi:methyl-accepting chemotaxis protein [Granulosicoccus antarcticus]|uniref:Methyl-accepting chemotaxis protein PctA n=1 Tax=Granulosicoccus antarcticus IMCC3135 TaxID=1192854 RepID=A0A2Z2NPH7_9GAMM|nr:methyl-accepting chemotaxis protein [Granulosicoccus antarcticus]ASJ73173.1 Methyl-accepting chemotaxis protein PctA [Granulosicoccus antarcticus IMCC3135]
MLKHVPITLKALLAPLFSSLLIALVVFVFYASYQSAEERRAEDKLVRSINAELHELSVQVETTQALLGRFSSWIQTGNEIDEALGGVPGLVANLELSNQMLSALEAGVDGGSAELVVAIRTSFDEYKTVFLRTAEVIDSNPYISTNLLISSYPAFDEMKFRIVALEKYFIDYLKRMDEVATAAKQDSLNIVVAVSGFAFLASLLAGWLFGRAIAVPVRKLSRIIGCLANGEYDVRVTGTRNRDELGVMALAVERFKEQLQEKRRLEKASQLGVNNERIRHALSSANTNLIVTDEVGDAIFVNHSMKALLEGVTKHLPQITLRAGSLDYEHLNLGMLLNDMAPAELLALRQIKTFERQLGEFHLQQIISPVFDENNQHIGLVFEWVDMTQRKAKEAQIQEANARERMQAEQLRAGADDLLRVVAAALDGDLTKRVATGGNDAIGQIGSALDRFFTSLAGNIRQISVNAYDLNEFSGDFEALNQKMHGLARESAQQIDDVSAASADISNNVSTVSVAVTEMNVSIREIARNSEQASVVAGDAVEIAKSADKLMRRLSESSISIGAMIKVITSIAEQTNLLALNATIEAARAGDAGKGFAVVANEVKELAKETAKATDEIRSRINAIQQDSDGAVSAINEISEFIVNISNLQGQIATGIQEQKLATDGISQSAVETDTRTSGIIENIAKVSASSEHTLAETAHAQESALKLKNMAGSMHALVAKFNID